MLKRRLFLNDPHPRGLAFVSDIAPLLFDQALPLFKYVLPLASFCRAPYSCDETSIVKCVVKAGCSIGALAHIANEMGVDLSHVDRRVREPTADLGLFQR